MGGTGSDLGVFRLQHDVLRQRPDLVFIEFAVNDAGALPRSCWTERSSRPGTLPTAEVVSECLRL